MEFCQFRHLKWIGDTEKKELMSILQCKNASIENLKQCSYLKCSYLKMGSHGNGLAVSIFMRRARLRSRAHGFHYSIEKRCGKLGRYVSLTKFMYSILRYFIQIL